MKARAGAMLVRELEQRYVVLHTEVDLGGRRLSVMRPRSAEELIDERDFEHDERLPYWAEVWPSSLVLAARLATTAGRGLRLLELGCGVGVVAAAAMLAGYRVLATDYYDDALRFARANCWRLNGREPETRHLDWRELPADLGEFDRVVAADVLYERQYPALVAGALARTIAPHGVALVADPGRSAAVSFPEECVKVGLETSTPEVVPYVEGKVRQQIRIYTVRRAPVSEVT